MHTESYAETLEEKDYLCDAELDGRLIIKLVETVYEDIEKFIWLRRCISGKSSRIW
jgi:hypothetical protein